MPVLYSKEKGKLGTMTGSIINWSKQLSSADPEDPVIYQTLPAGYLRCNGAVYQAEIFPELATILGTGTNCRYKKPDTTLLDNQFQVPDLGSKCTKTSNSSNLGDYQDTYLFNDANQEITKSGVGLEVSSNIGSTFTVQYQGNFFLPQQTIEITGQPGFTRNTGNYTEETDVLATAFQPHAHFHDGRRSRTKPTTGSDFSLFGRNSYVSKSSLCIIPWVNNTTQPLCQAAASTVTASNTVRVYSAGCALGGTQQKIFYGACWNGCQFDQQLKCLIPGDIPQRYGGDGTVGGEAQNNYDNNGGIPTPATGTPGDQTGKILQFACNDGTKADGTPLAGQGTSNGFTIWSGAAASQCGKPSYTGLMGCKVVNQCFFGGVSCNTPSPQYVKLPANYVDGLVSDPELVPFDSQPNNIAFGALNNIVTDIEEFGNDCTHKHLVPFNQDPHTYQVLTKPAFIPAGTMESTIEIDVNAENKADGYIQPFLVQEFLIKY